MNDVRGPDPTGEREELYSYLEELSLDREMNQGGRGLSNIVRQQNYVENHHLSAVAEKYSALIKKVFGKKRWQELIEEQRIRMSSVNNKKLASELLKIAKGLIAVPKLRMKTFMEQGKKTRKQQERDKNKYVSTVGPMLQKIVGIGSKARSIVEAVAEEFPGRNTGAVLSKRKNRWVKSAKQEPSIIEFSEYIGGPKRMYGPALYIIRDVVLGQLKLRDAKESAKKMAAKWFVENSVQSNSEVFEEGGYEPDFRDFLPPNISFEIGPTREVLKIVETFGREKKNWETMARKLAYIAEQFNDIVREVKVDMRSGDEVKRLCALMTAITIETGLRPGEVGNTAKVKDPDTGEKIDVETFGVTTMQPRHVKFIRNNFAELRFIGKKGTEQIAHLSDSDILTVLKESLKSTSIAGKTGMLFVTKAGEHVAYPEMQKYVREKWGEITPTDFRKLKATRTFYEKLKTRSGELRNELSNAIGAGKQIRKKQVVAKIMETLETAASDAQKALSHQDWKTTIKSYVDPRVVVNFLSQGGLNDTLEDILIQGKNVKLFFDFESFIERSKKKASPVVLFKIKEKGRKSPKSLLKEYDDLVENLM